MNGRRFTVCHALPRAPCFSVALCRLSRAVNATLLKRAGGALLATGAGLGLAVVPGMVRAATITVDSTADNVTIDGSCTLREAINNANQPSADPPNPDCEQGAAGALDIVDATTISGTITVGDPPGFNSMVVTEPLTIIGPGADLLTIDAHDASRFFTVTDPDADFSLMGLTLLDGRNFIHGGAIYSNANLTLDGVSIASARADNKGGGIFVANADLSVTNSTIRDSSAQTDGGGFYVYDGDVTLNNSTVSGNTTEGSGGGFYVLNSNVVVVNSTVSGNTAYGSGGGFAVNVGSATVARSTISGNSGNHYGGGFQVYGGNATLTHSTVSGNTAAVRGGGFYVLEGSATVEHSTVNGNESGEIGGGFAVVANYSPLVFAKLENSIVTNNSVINGTSEEFFVSTDVSVEVNFSLVRYDSVPMVIGGSNITGQDPQLGPLQDNGGPTLTHALLSGSPAIDVGDPAFVPPPDYDQRGGPFVRVFGGRLDMGALEHQVVPDLIFANSFEVSTARARKGSLINST